MALAVNVRLTQMRYDWRSMLRTGSPLFPFVKISFLVLLLAGPFGPLLASESVPERAVATKAVEVGLAADVDQNLSQKPDPRQGLNSNRGQNLSESQNSKQGQDSNQNPKEGKNQSQGKRQIKTESGQSSTDTGREKKTKEGQTIWLEEKIRPSTRWLEGLVKPMTSWMEDKIQKDSPSGAKARTQVVHPKPSPEIDISEADIIDADTMAALARELVPGQVLRVKLLDRAPLQYRVKLISNAGEIHMLYINARTGIPIQAATHSTGE